MRASKLSMRASSPHDLNFASRSRRRAASRAPGDVRLPCHRGHVLFQASAVWDLAELLFALPFGSHGVTRKSADGARLGAARGSGYQDEKNEDQHEAEWVPAGEVRRRGCGHGRNRIADEATAFGLALKSLSPPSTRAR